MADRDASRALAALAELLDAPPARRWNDPPCARWRAALIAARDPWLARSQARGERWPLYRAGDDLALLALHQRLSDALVPIDAPRAGAWLEAACGARPPWTFFCPSGGRKLTYAPAQLAAGEPAELRAIAWPDGPAFELTGDPDAAAREALTAELQALPTEAVVFVDGLAGGRDWLPVPAERLIDPAQARSHQNPSQGPA